MSTSKESPIAPHRGEITRLVLFIVTIFVWPLFGIITILVTDTDWAARLGMILASILAMAIAVFAFRRAASPNDYLTATGSSRILIVIFLLVVIIQIFPELSGSGVGDFVSAQTQNAVGLIGAVLIVATDLPRCFTIALRK